MLLLCQQSTRVLKKRLHLRAVTFDNITMANTGTGIRMKTERGRGGVVSDIIYRNMCAHRIVLLFRRASFGFGSFARLNVVGFCI